MRRRLVITAAAAAAVTLAGCAPIATQIPYDGGDGVRAVVGSQLVANNLMILTADEGEPGILVGSLTNNWSGDTTVQVQLGEESVQIDVAGNDTTFLTPDMELVELAAVSAPPGAVVPATVGTPESGAAQIYIPVLNGDLDPYGDFIPAG